MRLKDKVAIITGGSRGIGETIARRLSAEGCKVAIIGRNLKTAQNVAKDLKEHKRDAIAISTDVANKNEIDAMVKKVVQEFGRVDILVNNAGMSVVGASADLEETRWRAGIDVMLTGVFFCSQAAGREMIKQKNGKIINIASTAGIDVFPERACYCSAKAGVMALTKVLGCEWARYNINVNAVAPGYVETDLVKELVSKGTLNINEITGRTPNGRLVSREAIADAVVFLASEESRHIIGQTIVVDGGWTAYGYLESWLKLHKST